LESYLAPLQFHYNLSVHRATKFSPFELVYARKARWPYWDPEGQQEMFLGEMTVDELMKRAQDARDLAYRNNMDFRQSYTFNYNKDLQRKKFEKGDLVLLHAPLMTKRDLGLVNAKLNSPWIGPLRIEKVFEDTQNVLVAFPPKGKRAKKTTRVHVDRIKVYVARPGSKDPFLDPEGIEAPSSIPEDLRHTQPELIDVDDPTLTHWHNEEEDLSVWKDHHERRAPPDQLKLRFDATSDPVDLPGEDEPEPPPQLSPQQIKENRVHFQPMPLEEIEERNRPLTRQMVKRQPKLGQLLTKFTDVFRRSRRK
jgi:hypothetical protein